MTSPVSLITFTCGVRLIASHITVRQLRVQTLISKSPLLETVLQFIDLAARPFPYPFQFHRLLLREFAKLVQLRVPRPHLFNPDPYAASARAHD
jgi:hypothetical protein